MARTSGEGRLRWQQRGEDIVPRARAGGTGLSRDEARCLANCRHLTPSQIPVPYSGTRSSHVTTVKVLVCFCHVASTSSRSPSANLAAPVLSSSCLAQAGCVALLPQLFAHGAGLILPLFCRKSHGLEYFTIWALHLRRSCPVTAEVVNNKKALSVSR